MFKFIIENDSHKQCSYKNIGNFLDTLVENEVLVRMEIGDILTDYINNENSYDFTINIGRLDEYIFRVTITEG